VKTIFLLLAVGASFPLCAHDIITTKVTWSREISRLMYARCASCHREGGSAFSLMTYQEARPWAKAIKEEALERRMPPWGAVKGFGDFLDDQGLTQEQLELISDWVEGGAPEGDPKLMPKAPEFSARSEAPAAAGPSILVDGSLTLKQQSSEITGIRPNGLREGQSVKVVAERPDGIIEPLLWVYDYKPKFDHVFYFREPFSLPAGTKIVTSPPSAVSLIYAEHSGRLTAGRR
jgi:hypothetical protein